MRTKILNRLSVSARLWTGVLFIMLALTALLAYITMTSARLATESEETLIKMSEKVQLSTRWAGLTETAVTRVQAQVMSENPEIDALYKNLVPEAIKSISDIQKRLESMDLSDKERELIKTISQRRQITLSSFVQIRDLRKRGDIEGARREINERFNPSIVPYIASLNEFAALQGAMLSESQKAFGERRTNNLLVVSACVVALLVASVAGAHFLICDIRKPLNETIAFAQQIASGDLTAEISIQRGDEFGTMIGALNAMRDQLVKVVADVRLGTDNITIASREIAQGNHDLSARTEQAASNLQETAASMEQMSGAIKQSADAARVANQLASTAGHSAEQGGKVVGDVVRTMDEINQASRKINDIIGVIDGIAFQTNILALNAAVEAARAGEQGRGFAVVADEVRTLAQRSAHAAKEIKALIGNSVEKVTLGSELVSQAGLTMQEIVENVARVRDIIAEIANAAGEQTDGVDQINAAVGSLDQMTQQNAALVEESAAAASSLSEQATRLSEVVRVFRIDVALPVECKREFERT